MKPEDATFFWRQLFTASDRLRDWGASDYEQLFVNMTFNQLRMIKFVYILNREYPDGVTLKVLAESLSITPAAASEMVDALVRKDMLRREHNQQDRRAVAITLAPGSRKRFQECEAAFDQLSAEFLKGINPDERETFLKVLGQLNEYIDSNFSKEK